MNKIFSIFSTENLKKNLKKIISRFPLSVILIFIVTTLYYVNLHSDFINQTEDTILKVIFTLSLVFFFSIWIYISWENNNYSNKKRNILQLIPISFWILLYSVFNNYLDDFENFLFIILSSVWILLYLFFAPYIKNVLKNDIKQSVFYSYFYNMSTTFLISFILWLVLFWLWSIWITAIFELFDIRDLITDDIYWDWAILSLSFFTPIFALTQIQDKNTFNKNKFVENAFFSFLVKYITIPFIYVYFIILYAYTIKVLSNFSDWPKWEVSWMVIWFSIFWYINYIFSYVFEEKNKFIKFFRKTFPFVVIPQIFMLFYAIFLRINQYDITVNRYFVVVFGIWLLSISLYYILSKKKYLSTIPALLTIFTIFISIWPWSVHELPESRQLSRLKDNLIKAKILKNNTIVPLNNYTDIDNDLSKNIYSAIDYLCDFDSCEQIKKLFPNIYSEILKKDIENFDNKIKDKLEANKGNEKALKKINKEKYREPNNWFIIREITEAIKVRNSYLSGKKERETINFQINRDENLFPIDAWGYNTIYEITSNSYRSNTNNYANINSVKEVIQIIKNWVITETIPLSKIINELIKKDTWLITNYLSTNDMIFEIETNNKKYKLFFQNISIKNPKYEWVINLDYGYSNWYLLVK